MCHLLKSGLLNDKDINDILTDMVFTNFICPAVVSPDLFGISDAPISENARFNLIQIGQILQMLSLIKHEEVDAKFLELFDMFDRNIVSELMEQLLETEYDVSVSMMAIPHQNDFGRSNVLVTQTELNIFVDFLRSVLENDGLIISGEDRRKLGKILDQLPDKWQNIVNGSDAVILSATNGHADAGGASGNGNSRAKQSLINLGKSTKNKLAKTISLSVNNNSNNNNSHHNGLENDGAAASHFNCQNGHQHHQNGGYHNNNNNMCDEYEQVLLIPIAINDESKFQLLTEQEVLSMNNISNEIEVIKNIDDDELDKVSTSVGFNEVGEALRNTHKNTRFSLSNDDQSIGNTSDNLEVVSEVPSNHSVTSSLEMEENDQNLNDNLSDMVSANVSGRGSPNISGRDTPSSQVTEGDGANPPIPSAQMAKILSKARSDIDDKFCKFEINKLVEVDETISIISDTWSTDVLASDSETIETVDSDRNFSTPLIPSSVVLPGDNNFDPRSSQMRSSFLDASETRSESAWSTDVLASDSEKMAELDTDDNQSIAANSDITDAGRSDSELVRDNDINPSMAGGPLARNASGGTPESPFFAPRTQNVAFRSPDLLMFTPRSNDSVFSSGNRSFEDMSARPASIAPRHPADDLSRFLSPSLSFPRNSRDSNRYSENNLTFRSGAYRDAYLAGSSSSSRMKRQNSAESSISNQSSNYEDGGAASLPPPLLPLPLRPIAYKACATDAEKAARDYSFPDYTPNSGGNDSVNKSSDIKNPFADDNCSDAQPAVVEDVTTKVEQRNSTIDRKVNVDGRRNGVYSNNRQTIPGTAALNYENHEIIAKKSLSLHLGNNSSLSVSDDNKHNQTDEMLLIQKTMSMSLDVSAATDAIVNNKNGETDSEAGAVGPAPSSAPATATTSKGQPIRYTGAIPKSISFDESADKRDRNYMRRDSRHNHQQPTSFFNKIKQGFKNRNRNSNSSHNKSSRSDEFNGRCDEGAGAVGGDAFNRITAAASNTDSGFLDTTEDILAKYRRKASTSSEATNSDSIGNNRKNSQTDLDPRWVFLKKKFFFNYKSCFFLELTMQSYLMKFHFY